MTREEREANPGAYEKFKAKQRELMRKRRAEKPEIRVRDRENAMRWYIEHKKVKEEN